MNGYTYGDDNPITKTDPDGKWVWLVINAGFAIYDGYKAYKAGKNKKQIAWAVASNFIGIGHVKCVYRATKIIRNINHPVTTTKKVGSALKNDKYHNFSNIVDNYARYGTKFKIRGGDKRYRTLYQVKGSYNGKKGIFEWIIDPKKGMTHRLFIAGGKITGKPNQRVK